MIEDKLRKILSDGKYDNDVELLGRICIDIGCFYLKELSETQSVALDVARQFWEDRQKHDERRLCYLTVLCDRMDKFLRQGDDDTRLAILNRIVAISLMTTTGLSFDAGEFVSDLALDLSMPEDKLEEILRRHIPEYD